MCIHYMTKFTKAYLLFVGFAALAFLYKTSLPYLNTLFEEKKEVEIPGSSSINTSALETKDVVEEHIHILNKSCPLDVNNGAAKVTGVFLNGDKVTYKTKIQNNIDPEVFKEQLGKSMKGMMLYLYVIFNGERDKYLRAFIDRGLKQVFKLEFPNGETSEFTIHTDEFKAMRDYVRENYTEALQEYVNNQISLYNSYCPQEIDEGVVFESIYKENEYIVYKIRVDNETFNYCKSNYDQKKIDFYAEIKESSWAILETCKVAKIGIMYRLVNLSGSKDIKYEYPYDLLKKDPFIQQLDMAKVNLL